MTVERVRVGDVLRLERRAVQVDLYNVYEEVGVRSFGRGIFHKEPVDGASLGNKRVFRVEPGDLVISNVFAWEGAIAVAGEAEAGKIGSHRFMTFVPADESVDIRWASWFFLSDPGLELIRRASPGSAGRNRTLAIDRFEELEIPRPPIDEQRRIAGQLDSLVGWLDAFRRPTAGASALGESLLPSLLETHFAAVATMQPLGAVASVRRGRGPRYAVDSGKTAINQACVRWSGIEMSNAREVDAAWYEACPYESRVRSGDVLVNSTGEGTIGRATAQTADVEGVPFDSHVLAVHCDKATLDPGYLAAYLRSPSGRAQIDAAKGANTTKQTELGKAKLEVVAVPTPPLAEQRAFLARLARLAEQLDALRRLREERARLNDALLPAAVNEAFAWVS